MAVEWPRVTIGEIAASERNSLVGGPFGSNLVSRDYVDSGVPVIRGQNMGERWIGGEFAYVTAEKAASLSANIACPGDVIFTQRGTLGQVAIVPRNAAERYVISQSQMKMTVNDAVADPLFIYYVFRSSEQHDYVLQNAIQTGVPHINLGILRDMYVSLPSMEVQRAIAHILGTLDDKIELNRRMNETLEEMARAIFKSWFVDFDPVCAKAEGRDPGLSEHIADLFPDRFEHSDLGEIPAEWRVGTLAYYAELNPESWSSRNAPQEIVYVDLATTKWGRIEETQRLSWDESPSRARRVLRSGDTVVGTVRPGNGSYSYIAEQGLTGSTAFAVLRPHKATYRELVYLGATSHENIDRLSHLADGAAYPAVRPDVVSNTATVQPSELVIEKFSFLVAPLMSRIAANQAENRTLAAIRDALLPRLISGELRVPDAGRIVEAAVRGPAAR